MTVAVGAVDEGHLQRVQVRRGRLRVLARAVEAVGCLGLAAAVMVESGENIREPERRAPTGEGQTSRIVRGGWAVGARSLERRGPLSTSRRGLGDELERGVAQRGKHGEARLLGQARRHGLGRAALVVLSLGVCALLQEVAHLQRRRGRGGEGGSR